TNVNATVENTNAVSVTSPNIVERTTTVLVTSEDQSQQITYSIVFNVDQISSISSLDDITLSFGELDPEFNSETLEYVVMLPETTTQAPDITATPTDINASVDIAEAINIFSANQEDRTAHITVTAENGVNQTVYKILFNVEGVTIRDYVVFEKFSGIYCGACPIAIQHIHTLIEEGADIGVISYQSASSYSHPFYENPDADGMYSYYTPLISGFPTTIADGLIVPTYNVFEEYEAAYEERKYTLPAFGVQVNVTDNGNNDFTVDVIAEKVSTVSTGILRVVLTESHIDQLWMGETELNDICRKMLPDYNGTAINIPSGVDTISFNLEMDPTLVTDYCKIVAYVQNDEKVRTAREILGSDVYFFSEIIQPYDASIEDILALNGTACQGVTYPHLEKADLVCGEEVIPKVRLRNSGNTNLTSATIKYTVNNGSVSEYTWSGELAYLETEAVELPAIAYSPYAYNNYLKVWIGEPNNQPDEDPTNNVSDLFFDNADKTGPQPSIEFRTDTWPSQNRWELADAEGNILQESVTLQQYTVYNETFNLEPGCYRFSIYDDGGNGFSDYTDNDGYFIFRNSDNEELINIINFGYEWTLVFSTDEPTILPGDIPLYPVLSAKKALMLKTTASWCGPCGTYHWVFEEIYTEYRDEICSINAHVSSSTIGDPVSGAFHNILNGSGQGIPSFNLSGVKVDVWPPTVEDIIAEYDNFMEIPVVANVAFGYEINNDQINLSATTTFFDGTDGDFWVNAFILENGIEYEQNVGNTYETVIGERISRGTFIPTEEEMWGDNIANGAIETGTSFNSSFTRNLPPEWNADSLEFVVVIWQKTNDTTFRALSAEDVPHDYVVGVGTHLTNLGEDEIVLFPNPANEQLTLSSNMEISAVEMINVTGNLVARFENISTNSFTIPVAEMPEGMYFVRIHTIDGAIVVRKIIIK
nr:Omp28-related outer membrane protein [Bacteroidota bacterium]